MNNDTPNISFHTLKSLECVPYVYRPRKSIENHFIRAKKASQYSKQVKYQSIHQAMNVIGKLLEKLVIVNGMREKFIRILMYRLDFD